MSQSLEMLFKMSDNSSKTVRISEPVADLTQEKIEPVMQKLMDLHVYDQGDITLSQIKGARVKDTTVIFEA
jgi:hypothetical protein